MFFGLRDVIKAFVMISQLLFVSPSFLLSLFSMWMDVHIFLIFSDVLLYVT